MNHPHDLALLEKILARGLCHGAGDGKETFCAEQAVAVLCGLPVTDHPDDCVTPAVSAFGRALNDKLWTDEKTRAAGMRDFLLAQIGSRDVVDGKEFAKRLALKTVNRVLPLWLRHGKIDEALIVACEQAPDLASAQVAAQAARAAALSKYRAAYAAADAVAAAYADAAAAAAADAAAAAAADAAAAAYADAAAAAAAYAAAYADAAAAAAAYAVRAKTLPLAAQIAVEVLRELKSPGCELLH